MVRPVLLHLDLFHGLVGRSIACFEKIGDQRLFVGRQIQISLLEPCSAVLPAFSSGPGRPPVPRVLELLHLER